VFGTYDYTYGLIASVVQTSSCDTASWSDRGEAFIDRADTLDFVAMGWEAAQIDPPRPLRYAVGLGDSVAFDRAPGEGSSTLNTEAAPLPPAYPTPTARDIADSCDAHRSSPFTDTAGTTRAYGINCVSGRAITSGKTATTYDPVGSLTQGQTATFLVRTLNAAGRPAAPEPEVICGESDVHADNMERLMTAGIVPRASGGICGPAVPIPRERVALGTRNALASAGVLGDGAVNWYSDDDASPHASEINQITSLGIVTGKGNALYGPAETLTRGQMATFLARTLDALIS
jgi:hypothetical protein